MNSPATPTEAPTTITVAFPLQPIFMVYVCLAAITVGFIGQYVSDALWGTDWVLWFSVKANTLIAQGQLWRLITPIFVHLGLTHFFFNAYSLYQIGRSVERFFGTPRFTLIFFLTGLSASVLSLLLNPSPAAGASGAIFGLVGAETSFLYLNREVLGEFGKRSLTSMLIVIGINLLIGLQARIDNWAHLGGLIGGLVLGWFIGPVWSFVYTPLTSVLPTLADTRPLTSERWWVVVAFLFVCAALTVGAAFFLY